MNTFLIALIILIILIKTIINIIIYRIEYNYQEYTDGVAINFHDEEVEKRDNAVILFFLSLTTLFWINYKKKVNRQRVIASNTLFIVLAALLIFYLFYLY